MATTTKSTATTTPKIISTLLEGGGKAITGTSNRDVIMGTSFDDIIFGGSGDDILRSSGGNDAVDGGDGRDNIDAGDGNDTVTDGNGDDVVQLGRGNDVYFAGGGSDLVNSEFTPTKGVFEVDTADYSGFSTGVQFEIRGSAALAFTVNEAGVLERDSLSRFDVYVGTAQDDIFKISGSTGQASEFGPSFYTVHGGEGADTFVLAKFTATDVKVVVAATGETIFEPALAPVVADFAPGEDKIMFDAESFANDTTDLGVLVPTGVDEEGNTTFEFVVADLSFQNVGRSEDGGLLDAQEGNNVYVLQGSFESLDAATDALALALSQGDVDDGFGFGVYFDSTQGRIVAFSTSDLDGEDALIKVIGNFENDLGNETNIDLLSTLTADDFALVNSDFGFI